MPNHPADTADKPEDVATLRTALLAAEARIAALEQIIHSFKRARFGQSAERIDAAQLAIPRQSGCDERVNQDESARLDFGMIVAISGFCNA